MKSNKGITLTSLVIYIIAMVIVIAIISNITVYFYKNSNNIKNTTNNYYEFTRFNEYFVNDIKEKNIKTEVSEDGKDLVIIQGKEKNIYRILGNGIYRNYVKISNGIKNEKTSFYKENRDGKIVIKIHIVIGDNEDKIDRNLEFIIDGE